MEKTKGYLKPFLIGLLIAALLYMTASALALAYSVQIVFSATNRIDSASEALASQQYNVVLADLVELESILDRAQTFQKPSLWIQYIPFIGDDYLVYDNLLEAGTALSSSLNQIVTSLTENSISQSFTLESLDLQTAPSAYLTVHEEVVNGISHLIQAEQDLDNLELYLFPESVQATISVFQNQISSSVSGFKEYLPIIRELPTLLGADKSHEGLFILQNPHELRPTGGFIGTIGRLSIQDGVINQFYTDDVYNLDVNVLETNEFEAPLPIQRYADVPNWFLRDANWNPDFPTSAQQVFDLYAYESNGDHVDTLIAITPYPIQEFIKLTGPIEVDDIVFTHENLIDELQFRVEQEFWRIGLEDEERKIVINNLAQALKQRLFNLNSDELKQVFDIILSSLDQKEILLYTANPDLQSVWSTYDWTGEIKPFVGDYLAVYDANLGALKTDRLVQRSRNYSVEKQEDGRYKARLEIRYKNNGFFDYRTTRYRTYSRIYVPLGSELISSTGFVTEDKSRRYVQPEVYAEHGKTVFSGFISVEPGQERFAVIEYYLPQRLEMHFEQHGQYQLLVQKQPGVLDAQLSVTYSGDEPLFSFAPSSVSYSTLSETSIEFSDTITKDSVYTIKKTP